MSHLSRSRRCLLGLLCVVAWIAVGCHHVKTTHPQPRGAKPFVSYNKDGQKRAEGAYLNGKKHGYFVRWHRYGKKQFAGRFVHGKPQGTHEYWNRYGQLTRRFVYSRVRGQRRVYRADYVSGYLRQELFYEGRRFRRVIWQGLTKISEEVRDAGRLTLRKLWYANGHLRRLRSYRRGVLHGVSKEWYKNGQLASHHLFDHGLRTGPYTQWHPNGQRISAGAYLVWPFRPRGKQKKRSSPPKGRRRSCPDGVWRRWTQLGKQTMEGRYHRCSMVGWWRSWYPNGQLQTATFYKGNLIVGLVKSWFTNGQLASRVKYVSGYKVGEELWWYDNGKKKQRQPYVKGLLHGTSQRWDRLGRLSIVRRYRKGLLHGLSVWFFANGEPRQRVRYWKGRRCGPELHFKPSGALKRKRLFPACPSR